MHEAKNREENVSALSYNNIKYYFNKKNDVKY